MKKSKLFRLLNLLSEKELADFMDFAASPYFNKNKGLTAFLSLIIEHNLLDKEDIDKTWLLQCIYPGQPYQERWLPDLMYYLMNLLENFLAHEKYRQNSFQQKINLMMQAYEKEMEPMINGIERDIELLHSQNVVRDSNYFYESFMIHSERDYSFRTLGKISENESLQRKADHLDLFYLALKLKDSCEMMNRTKIVSVQYDFKMLDAVIDFLLQHAAEYKDYPAIQIYLQAFLMLSRDDHESYFLELKNLTKQNEKYFSKDELRSIYGYLQNYCIRGINQGNSAAYQHLFDLYKHILRIGLVFGDNKSMQWDFKNFVSLGLRLKEYEWTLQMINAFNDELPENIRQNAYTYNLSNYYYETGDYKKATKLLNSVEFTDIYYYLDSKTMLLKIYYKVAEEESFYSLVSSFGIFLRRNKLISKDHIDVYENLLAFTKKAFLLKIKLPYQRKKDYYINVENLKQKIKQSGKVANINWLLDEVEALGRLEG